MASSGSCINIYIILLLTLCLAARNSSSSSTREIRETAREREALVSTGWWGNQFPYNNTTELNGSHCHWPGISCNQEGRVISINLYVMYIGDGLGKLNFSSFPYLRHLYLDSCGLNGSIPYQIGLLTNLNTLDLLNNHLTGNIPYQLGLLTNLSYLDLSNNSLTRSIPYQLGLLTKLNTLYLYKNYLSGNIPSSLLNLTQLEKLDLSRNHLSGSIPSGIYRLKYLQYLDLSNNFLSGNIPEKLEDSPLRYLGLYNNNLTGRIPYKFRCNLVHSDFFNNKLSDEGRPCGEFTMHRRKTVFLILYIVLPLTIGLPSSLRSEFDNLHHKEKETIQSYLSKVSGIVNQMKSYGETIGNERVVSKVLRSLNREFKHVVVAIEESKDLTTYTFDELMCSLLAHEERNSKYEEKVEEKAFQVKGESSFKGRMENSGGRGRGRGCYRGRGRGRDRGRGRVQFFGECRYCKKYGHKEAECWLKQRSEQRKANFTENINDDNNENKLFVAHSYTSRTEQCNSIWFLDSGCSNHMSGSKELFKDLDESQKSVVRLGDDKLMQVDGKGTIGIQTIQGDVKLLNDVQFVPKLAHNLLSVGQLMCSGYKIEFDGDMCVVIDKKSGHYIANVRMTQNRMFPLDVSSVRSYKALAVKGNDESQLWHLRYGHLNVKGLLLLSKKEMVHGLPKIQELEFCEGCIYGKQARQSFPIGKSQRASCALELVHADLCGPMKTETLGGSRYFLMLTDDYTRMSWVYFLRFKSETFENFKKFKALVEKKSEKNIQVLRTDRGGEFMSKGFLRTDSLFDPLHSSSPYHRPSLIDSSLHVLLSA